ncbi:MAG: TonB family protein [Bryobacterales bacterium]|nr:TonB family protein [Bryobacterales bacterium]
MVTQTDILDRPQPLKGSLVNSLLLHGAIVLAVVLVQLRLFGPVGEPFGDPNPTFGGSVGISPVKTIPLPARSGRPNPVANDTESQVPQAPQPAPNDQTKTREAEETAISLKGKPQVNKETTSRRRNLPETPSNQVFSSQGAAVVSPQFGGSGGEGGGVGVSMPFGGRFGYYAQQIRDLIQRNWRTDRIPPNITSAPVARASFVIGRDGSVSNVNLVQRSGVSAVDYSILRAIQDVGKFPPLPAGFERSEATVEIAFEFRR